jgi:hypothetical protein
MLSMPELQEVQVRSTTAVAVPSSGCSPVTQVCQGWHVSPPTENSPPGQAVQTRSCLLAQLTVSCVPGPHDARHSLHATPSTENVPVVPYVLPSPPVQAVHTRSDVTVHSVVPWPATHAAAQLTHFSSLTENVCLSTHDVQVRSVDAVQAVTSSCPAQHRGPHSLQLVSPVAAKKPATHALQTVSEVAEHADTTSSPAPQELQAAHAPSDSNWPSGHVAHTRFVVGLHAVVSISPATQAGPQGRHA